MSSLTDQARGPHPKSVQDIKLPQKGIMVARHDANWNPGFRSLTSSRGPLACSPFLAAAQQVHHEGEGQMGLVSLCWD